MRHRQDSPPRRMFSSFSATKGLAARSIEQTCRMAVSLLQHVATAHPPSCSCLCCMQPTSSQCTAIGLPSVLPNLKPSSASCAASAKSHHQTRCVSLLLAARPLEAEMDMACMAFKLLQLVATQHKVLVHDFTTVSSRQCCQTLRPPPTSKCGIYRTHHHAGRHPWPHSNTRSCC